MAKFKNPWDRYGLNEAQYLFAFSAGYMAIADYSTGKPVYKCYYPRHSAQRRVWQAGRRAAKKGH